MNITTHKVIIGAAQGMEQINDNSIGCVVTSPPYPMIKMWDDIMAGQNVDIGAALTRSGGGGMDAFELMHLEMDKIWENVGRVLVPGGFACINIGDATRSMNGEFALYSNHSRVIRAFQQMGFNVLPSIIWRKQVNSPNKFMGSGMLPCGGYITLEHEWILIFRKGGKREFKTDTEKETRRESSFFWEERNIWFSDLWDLKGVRQGVDVSETRQRSAAYPFDLPYRLINMYSILGDTILDPFLGTGTTTLAAIASNRNSVGYEIDPLFLKIITNNVLSKPLSFFNSVIERRVMRHLDFVKGRLDAGLTFKYYNDSLKVAVMTKYEKYIKLKRVKSVSVNGDTIFATYDDGYCDAINVGRIGTLVDSEVQNKFFDL